MNKTQCVYVSAEEHLQILERDYKRIESNLKNIIESGNFCGICLENGSQHSLFSLDFTTAPINQNGDISLEQMVRDVFGDQVRVYLTH